MHYRDYKKALRAVEQIGHVAEICRTAGLINAARVLDLSAKQLSPVIQKSWRTPACTKCVNK